MTGILNHSPGDIIRNLLIDLGHGTFPSASGSYPVYVEEERDTPDNCLTVFSTAGVMQGRFMYDGVKEEKYGVQIRGRNASLSVGYTKLKTIADSMDQDVRRAIVYIGSDKYIVHNVSRTTGVIDISRASTTKRWVHVFNALVTVRSLPGTGSGT